MIFSKINPKFFSCLFSFTSLSLLFPLCVFFGNYFLQKSEKKIKIKTNKKVKELLLMIKDMHQGAIGGIRMCREKMSEEDYLDVDKTLHENGYTEPKKEPYRIIYDYDPVSCPLLDF